MDLRTKVKILNEHYRIGFDAGSVSTLCSEKLIHILHDIDAKRKMNKMLT